MERPELRTAHDSALGLAGGGASLVERQVDERVQARVAALDARDGGVEDLDGRQLPRPDAPRELGRARIRIDSDESGL